MKRILSLILTVLILTATVLTMFSCTQPDQCFDKWPENLIQYGEKYFYCDKSNNTYYDKIYYIFDYDGTGELHKTIVSSDNTSKVSSSIVYFEWRSSSDGALHFFKKNVEFKSDNTDENYEPTLSQNHVFASEDFIYIDNHYYIRENSSIFNLFSKAE